MSRYGKITGSKNISEDYQNINLALDNIEADVDAKAAVVTGHIDNADIHVTAADHTKLAGIEEGAQVNQPAFSRVNGMDATSPADEFLIVGDVGIEVTQNPNDKSVHLTVTGESAPGPHAATHLSGGSDPIPTATETTSGLMPPESFQAIEDNAEAIVSVAAQLADIVSDFEMKLSNEALIARIKYRMQTGDVVKIGCFGDSITYGYKPGGTGAQVANTYPMVLQNRLRTLYDNDNITVINEGHSGWQTDEALNYLPNILSLDVDLVIIMFGINDVRQPSTVLPPEYRSNLLEIVKQLKESGAAVIVMTPTPILDNGSDNQLKVKAYADVAAEVAREMSVGFVDMFRAIHRIWFGAGQSLDASVYPTNLLPDTVHFADDQYKVIADILLHSALHDGATDILYVDSREEFSVPVHRSSYMRNTATASGHNDSQIYRTYNQLTGSGAYIRFDFFCAVPNMSLILRSAKNSSGGILTVYDNGAPAATVNFYAPAGHLWNVQSVITQKLSVGWHSVLLDYANLTNGQNSGAMTAFATDFIFRPAALSLDQKYAYSGTAPVALEKFERVVDGNLRLKNSADAGWKGGMFFTSPNIALLPDKKIIIEAEGKWFVNSGISWFGNTYQNTSQTSANPYNNGYFIQMGSTVLALYYVNENSSLTSLGTANISLDFSATHLVRVEHDNTGNIAVIVDGTQHITVTDTRHRSGYFGLMVNAANAVIDLNRYEYCYI